MTLADIDGQPRVDVAAVVFPETDVRVICRYGVETRIVEEPAFGTNVPVHQSIDPNDLRIREIVRVDARKISRIVGRFGRTRQPAVDVNVAVLALRVANLRVISLRSRGGRNVLEFGVQEKYGARAPCEI